MHPVQRQEASDAMTSSSNCLTDEFTLGLMLFPAEHASPDNHHREQHQCENHEAVNHSPASVASAWRRGT